MSERPTTEYDNVPSEFPALRNELLRVYKECDQLKVERDEARDFLRNESTRADAYMDGMDRARRECANLEEIIRGEWPEDQAEELIRNAKEAAK